LKIKLDQMLVEIERLSDAYPAGKQGTVFQQLEQLVRAADNRLQILNPSQEEKSSANPNP
jgi:hypothetical protein